MGLLDDPTAFLELKVLKNETSNLSELSTIFFIHLKNELELKS